MSSKRASVDGSKCLEELENRSAKFALATKINDLIEQRNLNQIQAASIIGMTQPKVSQISRHKLHNISFEKLMDVLVALDQRVVIKVQSACRDEACGVWVLE